MPPVLPGRHDPNVIQQLAIQQGPGRLPLDTVTPALTLVSGDPATNWANSEATEPSIRSMRPFSQPDPSWTGWKLMPRKLQEARKFREMNTFPVIDHDRLGDDDRAGGRVLHPGVDVQQPLPGKGAERDIASASAVSPAASARG